MSSISMKAAAAAAVLGGVIASASTASAALNLPTQNCGYAFNMNLRLGSKGADVMNLQKVLNAYPQTQIASVGAGSPGMETSTFGPATRAAVNKFQALHLAELGINAPTGNVFAGTRALLNQICSSNSTTGSTGSTGGTATAGPVSVSASANQPMNVIVSGQASARLADFTFTGSGMVKTVKLARVGLSDDSTLKNVYLYDGMVRVAGPSSVNRDGSVAFSSINGLFAVAGSKTLTVRADVNLTGSNAQSTNGQTIGFAVVGVDTGSGVVAVAGVQGNTLPIGNVALATVNIPSISTLPSGGSISAGSVAQNIWERSVSVSTRSVRLSRATFKMVGSAPSSALANINLNVDGSNIATGMMDSNGYIVFMPTTPFELTTGSHTVKIFADVVGGSNRNFYISLEQASDVMMEDSQVLGAYTTLQVQGGTSNNSNIIGGTITVNTGTLTAALDSSLSGVTTVVGGATNQTLGKWTLQAYGEDVKVMNIAFTPTISGTANNFANVGLYVNGAQVRSNQTATNASTLSYSDLGTNLVIPAGQKTTIELRGDIVSSANTSFTSGSFGFTLVGGSNNYQGMSSNNLGSSPSAGGRTFTIGSASTNVVFAPTAGSAARTVSPNQTGVKIGSFTVQTGSAEGINVTQVAVTVPGTLLTNNKLTNLTVKDGSTVVGSVIGLPTTGDNTFSANIDVPVSTTKTLDIYGDIGSSAAGYIVTPTAKLSFTGLASRKSDVTSVASGIVTTANVGTIANANVSFVPASSPVAQLVVAGQTGLKVATFNFKSGNGVAGSVVKDVTFTVPVNTISKVTINGKSASVVGTTATIYGADITVPADASGVDVPVTVDFVCINSTGGCAGVSNSAVTLTISQLTYNDGEATNIAAGAGTATTTVSHILVGTKPTLVVAQSSTGGFGNGTVKVGEFTVAADAAGDVTITQIPVAINVSGVGSITASSIELRDQSGSTVITGSNSLSASGNFVITGGRKVAKGTSETYSVYATFSGVSGAAGTQSATFGLGAKANFLWNDVLGGVTGITGANVTNYPTNTQTRSN